MTFNPDAASWSPDTQAVRGGLDRTNFQETSEAVFLNSGFVYQSAAAAERAFTGEDERFVYSRYGNPSVATFQERLRLLEGTEACFATASGMSAVFTALGALLAAGDRVVAARSLFGSCFVILNEILPRWGSRPSSSTGRTSTNGVPRCPSRQRRCSSSRRRTPCRKSWTLPR